MLKRGVKTIPEIAFTPQLFWILKIHFFVTNEERWTLHKKACCDCVANIMQRLACASNTVVGYRSVV